MKIKDQCGILKKMIQLAQDEAWKEHGAFAVGRVLQKETERIYGLIDDCMIENIGGEETAHHVVIPARLSYAFLQNCNKEGNIPVVIHTHAVSYSGPQKEKVSFSPPDMQFMEKFSQCAANIGSIPECLFIVTDGETAEYCSWKSGTMEYTLTKERFAENA